MIYEAFIYIYNNIFVKKKKKNFFLFYYYIIKLVYNKILIINH